MSIKYRQKTKDWLIRVTHRRTEYKRVAPTKAAAEAIFAFFLESGFLAVLVFGWDRVSARMHYFATCMVATGSIFSSIWIVIANSWQQTPAGYHIVGQGLHARAEITDLRVKVRNSGAGFPA